MDNQQNENFTNMYQPINYPPPYMPPVYYKPKLRKAGSKRDMIFAGLLFFLSLLCVNFTLYGGGGLALSLAAIGLYITGIAYLYPKRRHFSLYTCFCMMFYVLGALSLFLSDSGFGKFLTLNTMVLLSGVTLMDLMDLRKQTAGSIYAVFDWLRTILILPFSSIGAVFFALFHKKGSEGSENPVEKRKTGSVLIGLGLAVPVLLVIVPLLTGADEAFHNLFRKLTFEGSSELIVTLILGIGIFILIFGQHFAAQYQNAEEKNRENIGNGIDTTILASFFCAICVVYALYLLSQLAYFFNAFAGLLPEDYTVAEYARRGFFEMTTICVINLGLLLLALFGSRKKDGKEPGILRALALFLCLFSLILIATAISKMLLYIDSFGLTHLRLLTSVFMLFLCVLFVTMILWLFFRKLPYMKVAVITAALLVTVLGFADPGRVVASYNVNAYLSGELDSVDMAELSLLNTDAVVPYAWELTQDPDPLVYERAWRILYDHMINFDMIQTIEGERQVTEGHYDWRAFNAPSYQAYKLLQEHGQEIFSTARRYGIR
ncbi:MAG: DUF4173 domain-containing protein [Oscillospiraceae bacterium]|nr:DUF4173 domain-containing protein [Oscillospiraceae bacterium]